MATLKIQSKTRDFVLYPERMINTQLCWITRAFPTQLLILQSRQMLTLSKGQGVCLADVWCGCESVNATYAALAV